MGFNSGFKGLSQAEHAMQLGMSNILCSKIHQGEFTSFILISSYHMA